MAENDFKWLLKNKIITDFRGYPIGRVKKVWYDDAMGPLVVVERSNDEDQKSFWEAIPLRAIDTVHEQVRLKPPTFAE